MKMVAVDWTDSHVETDWRSVTDAKKDAAVSHALTMSSVGYLVDETDDYLLLAGTFSPAADGDMVNSTIQIPVCAVTGRRDLHAGVVDHIGG